MGLITAQILCSLQLYYTQNGQWCTGGCSCVHACQTSRVCL